LLYPGTIVRSYYPRELSNGTRPGYAYDIPMHCFEQLSSSFNQRKREERDIYPDGDV
jgi:hypothetical protein